MVKSEGEFTNSHLKQLITGVLHHYKKRLKENASIDANTLYSEMYKALSTLIETPGSSLNHLEVLQKRRAYRAFDIVFQSLPIYKQLPTDKRLALVNDSSNLILPMDLEFKRNNSSAFDWLLLNTLLYPSHHSLIKKHNKAYDSFLFISMLALIIVTGSATPLAFIALYYLMSEIANNIERLWHNEGVLKPSLQLAGSLAFALIGLCMGIYYFPMSIYVVNIISMPLYGLIISAGYDPVVALILIGLAIPSLFGAAVGSLASDAVYDAIDFQISKDSIDPADSTRYRLTAHDIANLEAKSLDPLVVECAIISIRAQIASAMGSNEQSTPSFFNRLFQQPHVQILLNQIRQLRRGEISEITVGELHFDCKQSAGVAFDDNFECVRGLGKNLLAKPHLNSAS